MHVIAPLTENTNSSTYHLQTLVVVSNPGNFSQQTAVTSQLLYDLLCGVLPTKGHQAGLHTVVPRTNKVAEIFCESTRKTTFFGFNGICSKQGETNSWSGLETSNRSTQYIERQTLEQYQSLSMCHSTYLPYHSARSLLRVFHGPKWPGRHRC